MEVKGTLRRCEGISVHPAHMGESVRRRNSTSPKNDVRNFHGHAPEGRGKDAPTA